MSLSKHKKELNELFKEAKKYLLRYLLFLSFVYAYIALGAFIFFYIEQCYDVIPASLTKAEKKLQILCSNITDKNAILNNSLLSYEREFCENVIYTEIYNCELSLQAFNRWTVYTGTVVTTIGYGNVVTKSDTGKIVTMIYAIPGIALTAGTYIPAARGLIALTRSFLIVIEIGWLKRKCIKHFPIKVFAFQTCLSMLSLTVCGLLSTLKELEDYSLLNGIYLAFVSLTTIGFGDYYYKYDEYMHQPWLLLPSIFMFSVGLSTFASVISSISDVLGKYAPQEKKKGKNTVTIEVANG
ncbi:potassium channel subfamily K member 2-like [Hydractinia symbiolongicarpus]|uniref:potassium channel subfamily K member 2-like n=1 Tax=Hydractinia symbiolongicarpus TaxID=13093 RepID=UPI00254C6811|nr:potassium channel subfamily K member 2-like [Hydractinia symbiolongicarpus]